MRRAQFNLISSSLAKDLRPELRETILDHSLTPAQVAVLTPADLASAERAKEIEAARQAVLQQTVKTKTAEPGAIRLGRDGLERVEDFREKEMLALQYAEREARDGRERRESLLSQGGDVETPSGAAGDQVVQSPEVMHHQRSESTDTPISSTPVAKVVSETPAPPTPVRSFSLSSAWAAKDTVATVDMADVAMSFGEDQNQLDLSDIIVDRPDTELDASVDLPADNGLDAIPVVWTGAVSRDVLETLTTTDCQQRYSW